MTLWVAAAVAIIYSVMLFATAVASDRGKVPLSRRQMSLIYGLSLAVYATSWTFFGAVGSAVSGGLEFLPIYLGPILLFVVGYPLVRRTLRLGKSVHSTSIADFLSARYGKSRRIAALITIIAAVGLVPYIALQLKSIAQTLAALSPDIQAAAAPDDIVPIVAAVMAAFAILLGTRTIDLTQRNRGLVLTMAIEAVVKLAALLAMTVFALWLLAGSEPGAVRQSFGATFHLGQLDARFWTLTVTAFCAALCLPRQFHMTIVEAHTDQPDRTMRWTFPIYLTLTTLAVFPITLAGLPLLGNATADADMLMIALPLSKQFDALAVFVFLGGFAAASGMIIVSTVALSTMITNDLIVPVLHGRKPGWQRQNVAMGAHLLWIRRGVIVFCIAAAYLYYRSIDSSATLAGLGILSFAAAAQFAPGLIGGLYWQRGNAAGMWAGLIIGFAAWLVLLIAPTYLDGPPLIIVGDDPLVSGIWISLFLNVSFYTVGSLAAAPNLRDQAQAASFVAMEHQEQLVRAQGSAKRVADFRLLLSQFVGEENSRIALIALRRRTGRLYDDLEMADDDLIATTEAQLAGILGASSARALINSTLEGDAVPLENVVAMFDEASQRLQFSGDLLQTAIENIDQGVAVVNRDMRLVAWNSRYVDMFQLPPELVTVGQPVADLIAYNMRRSGLDDQTVMRETQKRIDFMRRGKRHALEREQHDGRILRIIGNPTPQKGYVTSYTDITADRRQEQALEKMVDDRTRQLTAANAALEEATRSKTRFLAAASHDLVQPMNAARLFTSALAEEIRTENAPARKLAQQIDHSIAMADSLLRTLLDISKLDGGGLTPKPSRFRIDEVFGDLRTQFAHRAAKEGLRLIVKPCSLALHTDKGMIVSILQNLVSNAIRYTDAGRVVLGARRRSGKIEIQVLDTGPGIADEHHTAVFDEFRQLPGNSRGEGVGLGLSLAQRLAALLGSNIQLRSKTGRGSCFSFTLPVVPLSEVTSIARPIPVVNNALPTATILCVDNDMHALDALTSLLKRWGFSVEGISGLAGEPPPCPDLLILDYQLDDGLTGDALYAQLVAAWETEPATILLTADDTQETLQVARQRGFVRQLKPASPMALRALISSMLSQTEAVAQN